jgi:hypothetical protein
MRYFILDKVTKYTGKKLDGHKTKLGGLGFLLYGIVGLLGKMFPDQGLPVLETSSIWELIFTGIAILGLAGKADKLTTAVQNSPTSVQAVVVSKPEPPKDDYIGAGPAEP